MRSKRKGIPHKWKKKDLSLEKERVEKKKKFDTKSWRSSAVQMEVKLQEISSTYLEAFSKKKIQKAFQILHQLEDAFADTGYDNVFNELSKIFSSAIFSNEKRFYSSQKSQKQKLQKKTKKLSKRVTFFELLHDKENEISILQDKLKKFQKKKNFISFRTEQNSKKKISQNSMNMEFIENSHTDKNEYLQKLKYKPSETIKKLKNDLSERDSTIHDLKYEIMCLTRDKKKSSQTLESEKKIRISAFRELKNQIQQKAEKLIECQKVMDEYSDAFKMQKKMEDMFQDEKFSIISNSKEQNSKNIFSPKNQVEILKNFHAQFELLENMTLSSYSNTFYNSEKVEKKKSATAEFTKNVKLIVTQMNVLYDKIKAMEVVSEGVESKKKNFVKIKSGILKEKNEQLLEQYKKNSIRMESDSYDYFQFTNPFFHNNFLEIYVSPSYNPSSDTSAKKKKKKSGNFSLLHRAMVTEKFKPTIIKIPKNDISECFLRNDGNLYLKLSHSRYNSFIPHSNVKNFDRWDFENSKSDDVIPKKFFFQGVTKEKILKDDFWSLYRELYGESVPELCRKIPIHNLRSVVFLVYLREYTHHDTFESYEDAPTMQKNFFNTICEIFPYPEVQSKVFFENLKTLERLHHVPGNEDLNMMYQCCVQKIDSSIGRCLSLLYSIIHRKWKVFEEIVGDDKILEIIHEIYGRITKKEADLILKDMTDSIQPCHVDTSIDPYNPKKKYGMSKIISYFNSNLLIATEYNCLKFIDYSTEISRNKSKLTYDEFNFVMKKFCPKISSQVCKYRFEEMILVKKNVKFQNDKNELTVENDVIDLLSLSRIYAEYKLLQAWNGKFE